MVSSQEVDERQKAEARVKELRAQGNLAEAIAVCLQILEMDSGHVATLHQMAQIYEAQQQWGEAIEHYRKAIEIDSEPPFWVYRHFGFALSQQEKWVEAVAAYQKAIKSNPEDVSTYGLLGQVQGRKGDIDGAISSYKKQIELSSDLPVWVYLNLGEGLSQFDRLEEAIEAYQKALELEPENAGIQQLLDAVTARKEAGEIDPVAVAKRLQGEGKLEEALFEYRAVLEKDGSNLVALHQVAQICEGLGRWEEAVEGYRRAIEVDAESPFWVYRHLGFGLSQLGDLDSAVAAYEKAVELNPEDAATQSLLGQVLERKGDLSGAVESYQRAIKLDGDSPVWVYNNLGYILTQKRQFEESLEEHSQLELVDIEEKNFYELVQQGNQCVDSKDWAKASIYYKKALELDSNKGEFWLYLNLGKALINLSKPEEALIYFKSAFQENPENLELLSLLGTALINQKLWEEAEPIYRNILKKEVGNFVVYCNLADSLLGQSKYTEAVNNYKKSIDLNPSYALSYLGLGDAWFATHEWDDAIAAYERALQLEPNNETLIVKLNKAKRKADFRLQINSFQIWYVIGEGSISAYYRVEHQIEILEEQGYRVGKIKSNDLHQTQWRDFYAPVIVIFRALYSDKLKEFIDYYKSRGSIIVFDIDDYVFELKIANKKYVDGIRMLTLEQQKLYPKWIESVRNAIDLCDYCTASTKFLGRKLNELEKEAFVIENGFDRRMIELASKAQTRRKEKLIHGSVREKSDKAIVRIGYGSGTLTHQKDFKAVSTALQKLLKKHSSVAITIVGMFDIQEFTELNEFKDRIEVRDLVPHDQLFDEICRFDINLAPLEVGNPYCDAKSELKYIQAGILSIPTVASPTATYSDAIEDGVNGFLASNLDEWFQKLDRLVTSEQLRKKMGSQAKADVLDRYYHRKKEVVQSVFDFFLKESLNKSSNQFDTVLSYTLKYRPSKLQGSPIEFNPDGLFINWIFPDFSGGSGGVSTALRIVKYLVNRGHTNKIWIHNPDLGKTPEDYKKLIQSQYHGIDLSVDFVPKNSDSIYGHAVIATDFASSLVAQSISLVNQRFYLVQDHEAEFNPTSYRSYLAKKSYSRNFVALSCGAWLHGLMRDVYGLESVQWELASDPDYYSLPSPHHQRVGNRIAFYCQESKARRLTDLGFLAFEILSRRKLDFHVDFFGEKEFFRPLPYSYLHHGLLSHSELAELYKTCTIGLVFSGTNYSIVPREMMACGLPFLEIASPSSILSLEGSGAVLVSPDPYELADRIEMLLTDISVRNRILTQGVEHTSQYSWVKSAEIIEKALIRYCSIVDSPTKPEVSDIIDLID